MDASLSDFAMPILVFCLVCVLINTGALWLVMNVILGSRGDGPFWKCLIGSLLLPVAIIIAIVLPGRGLLTVLFMCILGGVVIRFVFNVRIKVGISIFFIFMLTTIAAYIAFGMLGLNPVKIAAITAPTAHEGMSRELFRDQMKAALIERLEGEYNVGFNLPDDSANEDESEGEITVEDEDADGDEDLQFVIKPHDGHFRLIGSIDRTFDKTLRLSPAEAANWLAENVAEMNRYSSIEAYISAIKQGQSKSFAPGSKWFQYYPVPEEVAKFLKREIVQMTPTTGTISMLRNWETSGTEGLTSATASADPAAWELALNTQDMAAYQAMLAPNRTRREDHRAGDEDEDEPNRVKTMIDELFVTPGGNVEIMVEVHREARTAAEDVYNNKARLPLTGRTEGGIQQTEALIPALTFGGEHYVSLIGEQQPDGPRYLVNMEGFYKDVWYRIKFPVQRTAERTATYYRLMCMQRLKIARMLK